MQFQEGLNKKPMSKEEKKKLKDKKKLEKKKLKAKIKLQKIKEAKRRKKLKDAGIVDVGYILASSKPIGIYFLLHIQFYPALIAFYGI